MHSSARKCKARSVLSWRDPSCYLLPTSNVLLAASGRAVRCTCRGGWAVRARSRTYRAAPSMCRRGAGSPRPSNPKPNPDPNPNPNPNPNPWTLDPDPSPSPSPNPSPSPSPSPSPLALALALALAPTLTRLAAAVRIGLNRRGCCSSPGCSSMHFPVVLPSSTTVVIAGLLRLLQV